VGRDGREAIWNLLWAGFNPRARVGRDVFLTHAMTPLARFNPRARVGRDGLMTNYHASNTRVSIHAPAWGATVPSSLYRIRRWSFNPRARVGRDDPTTFVTYDQASFNPRARVGRDATADTSGTGRMSFNPRARVGRDAG